MDGYVALFVLLSAILLLAAIAIIKYAFFYAKPIQHIKMEIHRAYTQQERNQWRRELLMLRLCIVPGIGPKVARRISKKAYRD